MKLCVAFLFPFTLFGGLAAGNMTADAASTTTSYVRSWEEKVTLTNSSFTEGGSTYLSGNSLSGWNAIEEQSRATGMLIDVGTGTNTETSGANSTFSKNQDIYMLQNNPGTKNNSDSRIMMINSKTNQSSSGVLAQKGYRSSSVTLEANSYYRFSVAVKTDTNGDDNVSASVYVSGLKDLDGNELSIGYENLSNSVWKTYYIFIATGDESQTVTIDLYLGSAHGGVSSGAVFFDECYIDRYSQNAFMDLCRDLGYVGNDTYEDYNSSTCFLVNGLQDNENVIDTSEYNFDFEDKIEGDTNTLGDKWTAKTQKGHAIIADIRNMQPSDFTDYITNGLYNYVGDDLTDGNNNALILFTDEEGGFVQANSSDFEIEAHKVYKFSVNMKVSALTSGSFYVQVSENGNIYDMYPALLSDDEESNVYYELQSGKSSGYSSNVENSFTNSYQTIDFFVKGHQLYDTSVNLQFLLGDSTTNANGCVIVDNIQVEYATNEDFTAASNKLELASFSSTPEDNSQITNAYFNATQIDGLEYPIKADGWTSEIENEKYNQTGVVYLYDSEQFLGDYNSKYDWAGIYPGMPNNSTGVSLPNNVYLMYNSKNSYQSITSSSYALSNNSYYKLSFDYKNQPGLCNVNPSAITVEIIDENGITLYSREGLTSTEWNSCEIYFHTAETVSHNIQIKVSLGTEESPVGGQVYLDNFLIENFTEEENAADIFDSASAREKADLTDFYLHLSENDEIGNTIVDSPAYTVNIDEVYDKGSSDSTVAAIGGIISGSNNPYGEEFKLDDNNFLALQTLSAAKATISSKFTLTLEADKFYKLTFDLGTMFAENAENAKTDEHDCKYGVTVTIDKSEELSKMLKREGIPHQVLNAKYHAKEAEIVALAGQKNAVTIATNMAGRGTDIKLGEGVAELGGLKIIGTERHESRRIDNQLRGRAGRQGDPGESRFYISLEDDLMRLFGSERTMKLVDAMGMTEDEPIEAGMLTKAIENAQKKVEGNHFAIRKHLLEYDQVMNEQREIIYGERKRVLYGENLRESIMNMIAQTVTRIIDTHISDEQLPEEWDMNAFSEAFSAIVPVGKINIKEDALQGMTKDKMKENLTKLAIQVYELKEKEIGEPERMRELERVILLRVIDQKWMDHIDDMDQMRQGIGLHAYAQRDPLIEYKFTAYDMFEELSNHIQEDTLKMLYRVRIQTEVKREEVQQPMFTNKDDSAVKQPKKRAEEKVGRNDPCPCGSGKKYKQCCGRNA